MEFSLQNMSHLANLKNKSKCMYVFNTAEKVGHLMQIKCPGHPSSDWQLISQYVKSIVNRQIFLPSGYVHKEEVSIFFIYTNF